MKPADRKIYLASKSPRRRELLRQIGVDFELLLLRDQRPSGPDVSEVVLAGEAAEDYVLRVTLEKAECAQKAMLLRRLPMRPILAADTTVVLDGQILGKPESLQHAIDMLTSLSGRTHQVLTAIAVRADDETWHALHRSEVTFTALTDDTIRTYCATPEPFDKAGGYGIQGLAALFIEDMVGSYSSIMGLPLFETAQLLQQAGLRIL